MTDEHRLRHIAEDPRFGYDVLRAYLGAALFVRGALFVANPDRVISLVRKSGEWFWPLFVAHMVGIGHVCGGILLAVGLATRVAALAQIPILLGAVFQLPVTPVRLLFGLSQATAVAFPFTEPANSTPGTIVRARARAALIAAGR